MYSTPKKRRLSYGSSGVSATTKSLLSAQNPGSTSIVVNPKKVSQDGNYQSASSMKKASFVARPLSAMLMTDLIAPRLKFSLKTFGHDLTSVDFNTRTTVPEGTCKALNSLAGRQGWADFLGLPAFDKTQCFPHLDPNDNINYYKKDQTIMSVAHLMEKALDARNMAYSEDIINRVLDNHQFNVSETKPSMSPNAYNAKFEYLGGKQTHTFVNSGFSRVFITLWEVVPRQASSSTLNDAINGDGRSQVPLTPSSYILRDEAKLGGVATIHNNVEPQDNHFLRDEKEDVGFTYMPYKHDITSYFWKWSKPVKVVVEPGATFKYTMHFPAFYLNDFNHLYKMVAGDQITFGDQSDLDNKDDYIPKFTKFLCMRYHGEYAHDQSDTVADPTVGALLAGEQVGACNKMRYASCTLNHIQEEYHDFRSIPYQRHNQTVHVNLVDYVNGVDAAAAVGTSGEASILMDADGNDSRQQPNEMGT